MKILPNSYFKVHSILCLMSKVMIISKWVIVFGASRDNHGRVQDQHRSGSKSSETLPQRSCSAVWASFKRSRVSVQLYRGFESRERRVISFSRAAAQSREICRKILALCERRNKREVWDKKRVKEPTCRTWTIGGGEIGDGFGMFPTDLLSAVIDWLV